MFTNRNLKTDNVGQPVEIDLSYDIGAAGAPTARIGSSKWTLTRDSAGLYSLKAKALLSQRAVKHICHSGHIAQAVGDMTDIRLVPVVDSWDQATGTLQFRAVSNTAVVDVVENTEIPSGSRLYLRVKQEYAAVTQR